MMDSSARSGMTEDITSFSTRTASLDGTEEAATSSDNHNTNTNAASPPQTTTTPPPNNKRRVNFDTIMIREFDRTLGDNPATTHGPPLTLDWQYEDVSPIKVDEYEENRAPRRITDQMMIPGNAREAILLTQTPTTKKQIQNMISQVRSSRYKRQSTVAMQDFEEWHEAFEFISRRFRRFRKGLTKEKEQELLWEQARHYNFSKQDEVATALSEEENSTDDGCGCTTKDTE